MTLGAARGPWGQLSATPGVLAQKSTCSTQHVTLVREKAKDSQGGPLRQGGARWGGTSQTLGLATERVGRK